MRVARNETEETRKRYTVLRARERERKRELSHIEVVAFGALQEVQRHRHGDNNGAD